MQLVQGICAVEQIWGRGQEKAGRGRVSGKKNPSFSFNNL